MSYERVKYNTRRQDPCRSMIVHDGHTYGRKVLVLFGFRCDSVTDGGNA
jgi:hypothetical protein